MKTDILGLIPPTAQNPAQDRWQRTMAVAVIGLTGCLAASTAALGAGLYRASTERADLRTAIVEAVAELKKAVKDESQRSRVQTIEGNIAGMHARYCDAVYAKNRDSANNLNAQLTILLNQYMQLTGLPYAVLPCA